MSSRGPKPTAAWRVRVNAKIVRRIPDSPHAGRVAAMFGLADGHLRTLYDDLALEIAAGQIVAVVGPSGAGKTVFLREVARQIPGTRWLRTEPLAVNDAAAIDTLAPAATGQRLAMLSRCGLADAAAMTTPAKFLSGGEQYRLALAEALLAAERARGRKLVVADEFAATLDAATAANLCRQVRKRLRGSRCALLVATPRAELLAALEPDRVVVKPLGEPGRVVAAWDARAGGGMGDPKRLKIQRGGIADYRRLAGFHYLAGPPAAHKRVYAIRTPGGGASHGLPDVAAVLVVSPPVFNVRGRNLATGGRYAGADRRVALALLNEEVECISRVIVHPIYRGCGLAVRLVRHAVRTAETPRVEALAAMGAVHPFFEKAGMIAYPLGPDEHVARLLSAAEAVGLSDEDLAAVAPVRRFLKRRSRAAHFLRQEIDLCVRRTFCNKRLSRLADPQAEVCRRTARGYVYYFARTPKEART